MNKKKLLAILLSGAMALSLAACGSDTSNDTTTDTSGDGRHRRRYTVGICQQMQRRRPGRGHPGLPGQAHRAGHRRRRHRGV